jgi:hypothetical protein
VAQCRRGRRCGSSASMYAVLVGFLASLPLCDQYCSRAREEPHRPRYRPSISDTKPVSRDTPPVSQIPGWYPSCSLAGRPGGSRHRPYITLMLFAAQITDGGGLSSTVSSVSGSGTRCERGAPCRRSRCGDRRRRRCAGEIPFAPAPPAFYSCASVLRCVWIVAGIWALL